MLYKHAETGEIKSHQQWQNELGMSFHSDRPPEFLERYVPPVTTPTLEQRRDSQRYVLKAERERLISEPIDNIQVKDCDRDRLNRAIARGVMPTTWIMADNTRQVVSLDDAVRVIDAYDEREFAVFETYRSLLDELEVTDNPESVVWPDDQLLN